MIFLANIVISHVLIGFMMTRSPSMLIKGARLCQKEVLCTASIGVQYCGDMVARGPPKHQSNWNFLAFSEPAHQMEPKNASGAMECPHSCNLGHPTCEFCFLNHGVNMQMIIVIFYWILENHPVVAWVLIQDDK